MLDNMNIGGGLTPYILSPFKLYRQDHVSDKYTSMAICTQKTVDIKDIEYFPSLNATKYELLNNMTNRTQNVLQPYRKQNTTVQQQIT